MVEPAEPIPDDSRVTSPDEQHQHDETQQHTSREVDVKSAYDYNESPAPAVRAPPSVVSVWEAAQDVLQVLRVLVAAEA